MRGGPPFEKQLSAPLKMFGETLSIKYHLFSAGRRSNTRLEAHQIDFANSQS